LIVNEGVLDRFAPLAHLLRMLVEPALNRLENRRKRTPFYR
jgi:hypothetical protein